MEVTPPKKNRMETYASYASCMMKFSLRFWSDTSINQNNITMIP